ncbi:DNA repair protein RecO [Luminiphilus sp.]|nr:DNA repair protein RecO [Luminiphilus sp.]MDA7839913.1 DNA repair protein RecO [Luminiphilus sp.]MDA8658650.1 DNA repair protein RecO [Luminiphilus sp.]MDA9848426.1 DNA repair protein RecO [Luminiphilus sp.]MDB2352028.1 DNA repair protein RecO [Luminiphilus sp.]
MASELEPAWLLHRRNYGDGGFLVDVLGLNSGRISAVVRGARRKARGGSHAGVLQPFIPLLVATSGRGELKTLNRLEVASATVELTGERIFSGFYLNELLVRLLPKFVSCPTLFARYGGTIEALMLTEAELDLRKFELTLLEELGYGLRFDADANNDAVEATKSYFYDPAKGFLPRVFTSGDLGNGEGVLRGDQLLNIADWLFNGDGLELSNWQSLKELTRVALQLQLGDRPLKSRELLKAFRWREEPVAKPEQCSTP